MRHEQTTSHVSGYTHRVWLASLGVLGTLQKESGRLFNDFVEEGKRVGEWLTKAMGGNAKIIEIEGTIGSSPANDRKKGFGDVIAADPTCAIAYWGEAMSLWHQIWDRPDAATMKRQLAVVKKGQTLCIIEAMKLMNEIESEIAGKVTEILAENGQPVEFGQALFRIEPL